MSDSISLPKVVEAFENGLKDIDHMIGDYDKQIQELQGKRDKALVEAKFQRDVVNALCTLRDELAKDNSSLKLRFP